MVAKKKTTPLPYLGRVKPIKPPVPKEKKTNLGVDARDARRANGRKVMAQSIRKFAKENPDAYSRRTAR